MHTVVKYLTVFLWLFTGILSANATHIVGGEFEIIWRGRGSIYDVYLNLYYNNETSAVPRDPLIMAGVYEKNTNIRQRDVQMSLQSSGFINVAANACVNFGVSDFRNLRYVGAVDLSGLNSPNGYYITYQVVDRTSDIVNINDPLHTGEVYYLEFPGDAYKNSSPVFRINEIQYFCKDQLNTYDFSGQDPNGDSLVYSLSTPLRDAVHVNSSRTSSSPAPFNLIDWVSGYSATNAIHGSAPLTIDRHTGMLSFNPNAVGRYLFGVTVEEYRNGVKIGEIRRDFILKVWYCDTNQKPDISFTDASFKSQDTLVISLKDGGCFPYTITDPDAVSGKRNETIFIQLHSGGYPASFTGLPSTVLLSQRAGGVYSNEFCFNPCGQLDITQDTYYPMSVIIRDLCPAKYDTLLFTLKVVVPPNVPPQISIDPATDPKSVNIDSLLTFMVKGSDGDALDKLNITIYDAASGMSFPNPHDSSSTISGPFVWRPDCDTRDKGDFHIYFVIIDNSCIASHADTVYQTIQVHENVVSFESLFYQNLATPNNDGHNDSFEIPGIPLGNCTHFFKKVEVYNVWGAKVFSSSDRHFKWYPTVSDGLYFYVVDLNSETKTGWLEILVGSK